MDKDQFRREFENAFADAMAPFIRRPFTSQVHREMKAVMMRTLSGLEKELDLGLCPVTVTEEAAEPGERARYRVSAPGWPEPMLVIFR
jgi:hypothetical protein